MRRTTKPVIATLLAVVAGGIAACQVPAGTATPATTGPSATAPAATAPGTPPGSLPSVSPIAPAVEFSQPPEQTLPPLPGASGAIAPAKELGTPGPDPTVDVGTFPVAVP